MNTSYKGIFAPAKKHTLADDVVASVREAIFAGQLSPGEQIGEEALARSLNISRGPIREALNQLEHEGLIITRENGRRFVARLSREDLEEVYGLRTALELLAVREAVRRAGAEELGEMQAIIDGMEDQARHGLNAKQAAEFDISFHDSLCRASRRKRLYQFWSAIHQQIQIVLLTRNVANDDYREHVITTHQAILDAISERNEERAVVLMQTHLQASYKRIIASYDHAVLPVSGAVPTHPQ